MRARSVLALSLVCTLGTSCSRHDAAAPLQAPTVLVAPVGQQDVPIYSEWVGTLDGYINAQIRAKVQGYLLTTNYRDGATVKAGQPLYQLDPRQYRADLDKALGDLSQTKANVVKDQQNVARYEPLVKVGAVSKEEYDSTVQQLRADQAATAAAAAAVAAAELNLEWTKIIAPIDGVAGITQAQVGDLIAPSTLMTTVSQLDLVTERRRPVGGARPNRPFESSIGRTPRPPSPSPCVLRAFGHRRLLGFRL